MPASSISNAATPSTLSSGAGAGPGALGGEHTPARHGLPPQSLAPAQGAHTPPEQNPLAQSEAAVQGSVLGHSTVQSPPQAAPLGTQHVPLTQEVPPLVQSDPVTQGPHIPLLQTLLSQSNSLTQGLPLVTKHDWLSMWLVSIVTEPVRARARPDTIWARVFSVMLASATMLPTNTVSVSSVAELTICQNTLQVEPPLITLTDEFGAVVRALPILKTNWAAGLPCASRTSAPDNDAVEAKQ